VPSLPFQPAARQPTAAELNAGAAAVRSGALNLQPGCTCPTRPGRPEALAGTGVNLTERPRVRVPQQK